MSRSVIGLPAAFRDVTMAECAKLAGVFLLLGAVMGCARNAPDSAADTGVVYHGLTSRIRSFDPVKAGDVSSAHAISKVYEGLLQYSYLARPYRVEPCLAEKMPEISPDGLTYTFTIRKGIFFQDDPCFRGSRRELVADDFVYSIKRVADLKNESNGYWAFNDRIVGLDEFRAASGGEGATDYAREVAGLTAPDRYTFRIVLKRPYPQLLWILTMQYAFAVPREAVEFHGQEFVNHPVGTGPYVLTSFRRNYRVEFERNPMWALTGRREVYPAEGTEEDRAAGLLADAGAPIPFIDRIVQYVIEDPSTQWLKFVTGETESSGISRDNWDAVIGADRRLRDNLSRKGIRLFTTPTLDVFYIGFNMEDPVVGKNVKLRQALSCAFNTGEWITFHNARIFRAVGPIPPGVAGYAGTDTPFPFDLALASNLLAQAGYPGGVDAASGKRLQLTIELGSSADPDFRESMDLIRNFMEKIGVVLTPSYNNWPTFLGKLDRRQCQLYSLGWVADYPDAENFLQLFYGPNGSPGPNHSNYANPEFDKLYEQVRVMNDSPERTALYRKMADIVVADCPWIFMHHPMSHGLHHCWFGNYKPHDFPYGMIKYQRIDDARRAEWQATHGRMNWRD